MPETRANRTPQHDAFQEEIDRLCAAEEQNDLMYIAHELIRHATAAQLCNVRAVLRKDGIQNRKRRDRANPGGAYVPLYVLSPAPLLWKNRKQAERWERSEMHQLPAGGNDEQET